MATTSAESLLDGHAWHARLMSGGQVLYAAEILRRIARAEETATLNQRRVRELERQAFAVREAAHRLVTVLPAEVMKLPQAQALLARLWPAVHGAESDAPEHS